jgi:hypothetical protein
MFLPALHDLQLHMSLWNTSSPASDSLSSVFLGATPALTGIPVMWIYVFINVVTQYVALTGL